MSRKSEQLELFAAFNAAKVEYAVVGGVAVNAHGFIRNTRDLDIFMRPTEDNACAAFQALQALGASLDGMDPTDLLTEDAQYQFDLESTRMDLLTFIGGMSFDQVWRNRIQADIDGVTIPFISRDDLIENKRQVGQLIDLADADQLERLPPPTRLHLPAEDQPATNTGQQIGKPKIDEPKR